jgi:hypothetical protein
LLQRTPQHELGSATRRAPEPSFSGRWFGRYDYPIQLPSVPFTADIDERDGKFSGRSSEPNTFSQEPLAHLLADLDGYRSGEDIRFEKAYRGVRDATHKIEYRGVLSSNGDRIEGYWTVREPSLPPFSGSFYMQRLQIEDTSSET